MPESCCTATWDGEAGVSIPDLRRLAETADARLDCLDADRFKYSITASELAA
jgi:hypothetical protein